MEQWQTQVCEELHRRHFFLAKNVGMGHCTVVPSLAQSFREIIPYSINCVLSTDISVLRWKSRTLLTVHSFLSHTHLLSHTPSISDSLALLLPLKTKNKKLVLTLNFDFLLLHMLLIISMFLASSHVLKVCVALVNISSHALHLV